MVDKNLPVNSPRELVQRLCAERGEDFAALSRLVGRNPAYIQQFVSRGTPRRLPERERRILARHFGISEAALGADFGGAEDAAGRTAPPLLDGEREGSPIAFASAFLTRLATASENDLRLVAIAGDAMAPTLLDGDEVLVDLGDGAAQLRDGTYLLRIRGRVQPRRLTLEPSGKTLRVSCDHPDHADWTDRTPSTLDIVGRIVWVGRRIA